MSNKKHIDRVFQEKLKDLEVSPSPKVWQKIKEELKQSDDNKKVFPIWLRLAGVAALILILFTIGNIVISNTGDSNDNKIVDTEDTSDNQNDNLNTNNRIENNQNPVQDETFTNLNLPGLSSTANNDADNNQKVITNKSTEFNTNQLNNKSVTESNTPNSNRDSEDKNNYSFKAPKTPKTNKALAGTVTQKNKNDISSQPSYDVAQNEPPLNKTSNKTDGRNLPNEINNNVSSTPNRAESVAQNHIENQNNNSGAIPELDKDKADAVIKNKTKGALAENQSNSKGQEDNKEQENTTADEETNEDFPSIEEEIAIAKDIIEKEEEKVDRWQVYAIVAPVYYNTLGKGSHIDDQFVENSKSGEINTSYGVNVSYVLNKKLKLRSGFNSLNLSYDTDNVILYENVGNNSNSSPRNLDLNASGQSFSAISNSNLGAQQLNALFLVENANAAISQRISYYEVPLELEYNLVDNKFGVDVIGGFSTFILNDNKVYSEYDGYKTEVGEANNINSVSFSGNLGLGLDYKFSDKIKFNVQPTFKYQLNAYKNTSGNFRPYIIGVYTGLSYKF